MPVHPRGFLAGVLVACDLEQPPLCGDRDPNIFLRIRGHDELYVSGGEYSPGLDQRVRLNQLDKVLSDIFLARPYEAPLFVIFEGGTYGDLIHVIDTFLTATRKPAPLGWSCEPEGQRPLIFLLTAKAEQEMVQHYGRCRVGPPVRPICWEAAPTRLEPVIPEALREPEASREDR